MRGCRIGIVGPGTPFGQRVRKLLGEGELPVIELKLFEGEAAEGATLTQFGEDVVVTQPVDPDLFPHLDALLVGGNDSDLLNRIAAEAGEAGVLTLVEGALGLGAPLVTPGRLEALRSAENRLAIVPRVESHLLGATLAAIAEHHHIERAVATVLVPAHSTGDAGAEELHQQIVNILNFKTPPTEVLHEQLAFNVRLLSAWDGVVNVADTVAWEASRLAGIEEGVTVSLVQVPVFHGYSASLWIETRDRVDARTVRSAFRSSNLSERTASEVTYEITATLDPKCPVGNWMSDLTVETNARGIESMRVPVTVNVVPAISVSPDVVKLGALPMGDAKSFDVTMSGLQPFKVLEVKGGGDEVSVKPVTEGSRLQHTLKVDVKASESGELSREIQIMTDSKEMPKLTAKRITRLAATCPSGD